MADGDLVVSVVFLITMDTCLNAVPAKIVDPASTAVKQLASLNQWSAARAKQDLLVAFSMADTGAAR